jgi:hypothetical protein
MKRKPSRRYAGIFGVTKAIFVTRRDATIVGWSARAMGSRLLCGESKRLPPQCVGVIDERLEDGRALVRLVSHKQPDVAWFAWVHESDLERVEWGD